MSKTAFLQALNKSRLQRQEPSFACFDTLQVNFMEKPRMSKGRHWYIAGAAVAALAVVGVVAKAGIER